ncbi:MAG: MFS transporter, partial [Pseudomonadota bacterium]
VMITGAGLLTALMVLQAIIAPSWPAFLCLWVLMGVGYSATLTPQGRLLRRSAHSPDRPAVFTAQFALSHACWLLTYPLAGSLMTGYGAQITFAVLAVLGVAGVAIAIRVWPTGDPVVVPHSHPDLPDDHPHLKGGGHDHAHPLIIDDDHHAWPTNG